MSFIESLINRTDPYIIAEVGSNYKSRQDLIESVYLTKSAGADAVKFQYFTLKELYGPTDEMSDLPLKDLSDECALRGIDFMCSAFSPDGVRAVDPFVKAHKIASSEMCHLRMLEVVKATGKPLFLSTGGQHFHDINRVLEFLGPGYPVVLMHCNLKYPAKLVDLVKFRAFDGFSGPVGFSDHTTSIDAIPVLMCKVAGCKVIEKHFNPFGYTDTPDAPHSLDQKEFSVMVSYLTECPIGYSEENEGRLKWVRRVIATKDLSPGEVLIEGENMGIFRVKADDERGVNPFEIPKLEGRRLKAAVQASTGISFQDVE